VLGSTGVHSGQPARQRPRPAGPLRVGRNARPVSPGPSGPTRGQGEAPAAAGRPRPSRAGRCRRRGGTERSGTGWSASCTAACREGCLPGAGRLAGRRRGCLTQAAGGRGVPGGCTPPAILATRIARGQVVQVGHRCREVKRDGTAGLVGCIIKGRRRRHHPAGEFGRLPRSRLTAAQVGRPVWVWS